MAHIPCEARLGKNSLAGATRNPKNASGVASLALLRAAHHRVEPDQHGGDRDHEHREDHDVGHRWGKLQAPLPHERGQDGGSYSGSTRRTN